MAYATQLQIQMAAGGPDRFTSLFDWNNDGTADADVIAEAQLRADGMIDGYLRLRFATPIATPSDTLIRLSADECVFWARYARGMLAMDAIDDVKHKERIVQLEGMRDGKIRPDEPLPLKSSAVVAEIVEASPRGMRGLFE